MSENGKEHKNGHEQKGDLIHNIIGHMEHLMDIFEIGIAIIVAFGFLASVYPLLRELPMLGRPTGISWRAPWTWSSVLSLSRC